MSLEESKYDELLRLADAYDQAGEQMRRWADLGPAVLADPEVRESAELSPKSWTAAEDAIRGATVGEHGLLSRSLELDADALVLRATVLTYRWIDELQTAAYQTLGSIAGRAIGYLAPEIELGGAVVSAGLIETEALDRDGMAAYLGELALTNPELMEHVTTGGGLAESMQVRALLTSAALADDPAVRRGGLRAAGIDDLDAGIATALRDAAAGVAEDPAEPPEPEVSDSVPVDGLAGVFRALEATAGALGVRRIGEHRALVLLPAADPTADTPDPADEASPLDETPSGRLVAAGPQVDSLDERLAAALGGPGAAESVRLLVVGSGANGAAALMLARSDAFRIDQVITANAPATHLHGLPADVPVISFDHRTDPVALLGSLINAGDTHRLTVLYDESGLEAAGAAADASSHASLRGLTARLRELGYLA